MSTGAYWPGGADSGANVASAASRKPAISCTDSPLMRMASRIPPSSRSETRPSSMAWYKSWASSRVMLRAPFLPRPISLMKRAAGNGVVDMVSVVMALAYTQTPRPFRPAQAKRLTAETIAAHFSYTMCPPKRPPSREASHHDLPRHRKHQRHLLRPDAVAGSAARAAAADRQRVRHGDEGPRGAAQYHRPQGPAPVRRRRPVLDPRPGGRPRLRAPPETAAGRSGRHHAAGDARVFRKAAHHHRLEGLYQRPGHGRFLPRQRRHGKGPPVPARRLRTGPADGHRGARPDLAAVPGRPDRLDRHRRAHHRIADAPRNVVRPVDAGRLQERHRRRHQHRRQRHPVVVAPALLPGHKQPRSEEHTSELQSLR